MSQSFCQCYLHVVFSTKERYPFLSDPTFRTKTHAYLAEVAKRLGCTPVQAGGVEDHVHLLCILGKQVALTELVKELKRASTRWIRETGEAGLEKFSWQSGYGAFSVSASAVDEVKQYILHQEEHHQRMSFQDEYRSLLAKYGAKFDEAYVWD
ncbi:REP element-mobilizing transposase RayT [Rubritalea squalenifaciens DSM 18772]|uniref:REP element-mobilizing transposase RayT n=1 Tax=Rubritalea squalenifaciens DSM 18772 TaxID=1123071 RepID=A0A1M6BXQ7_9BACT|nr:IS200/IS605 family transposase [Rubritalea squalenifaciens]SHI53569.1 REP element-mobilizing transposase RayT [Rubritalea squalenifaciens DSM 18772]